MKRKLSEFSVDPHSPLLDGHFPGNPIVPGAHVLERVVEAIGVSCSARIKKLSHVKFSAIIPPAVVVEIWIDDSAKSTGKIIFEVVHATAKSRLCSGAIELEHE